MKFVCESTWLSPGGSTATLTVLWQTLLSIVRQTHEKLTSIYFVTVVWSRSLTHRINYKFMCLSAYWQWKLANERARISAVIAVKNSGVYVWESSTPPVIYIFFCVQMIPWSMESMMRKAPWKRKNCGDPKRIWRGGKVDLRPSLCTGARIRSKSKNVETLLFFF